MKGILLFCQNQRANIRNTTQRHQPPARLIRNEWLHTTRCILSEDIIEQDGCFVKDILEEQSVESRENHKMSDAASENESKRPRVANPYLKQKSTTEALAESSKSNNSDPVAKLPALPNVDEEPNNITSFREPTTFGEKEPAVERLPSRNVSFGSAEILSVEELHQHASLYNDRSVRITGVVLHRLVAADGNVCLVMGDPKKTTATTQQQKLQSSFITKTMPMGIHQRRGNLVLSRKRPLSTTKTLITKTATTPLESMVTSLVEHQTVLVYAISKQVPVNDVAVGDLVMIIGECRSTCNTTVVAIQPIVVGHDETTTTAQHFLHARIVRNVNGTDMQLHDEALRMRRQHLLQMFPESKEPIRPGCGPPPYYNENKKEASV